MATHSNRANLIDNELVPAIMSVLANDFAHAIASEVCTRMMDSGLIVWTDGMEECDRWSRKSFPGYVVACDDHAADEFVGIVESVREDYLAAVDRLAL